ncbi:MAG TPA: hypothetical protein VGF59_18030, partial [Bryobacteraceae bacterium]
MDADTYKESEHPGSAFVVEMVAAEVIRRRSRAGTGDSTPPIDAKILNELRRLTHEAVVLESLRRRISYDGFESPEGDIRARAAVHHLMLRGPGWPWQEEALLQDLFGSAPLRNRLVSALGFGPAEAVRCSHAMTRLIPDRVHEHMTAATTTVADWGPDHPAHQWASQHLQGWQTTPHDQQASYLPALWALNHLGDAILVDPEMLATSAEVAVDAAACFLDRLGQSLGQEESDWFRMAERVRARPYLEIERGRYLLTVPGNDLWALRTMFEEELKSEPSYLPQRGRWLESRAVRLIAGALSADEAHLSVNYEVNIDGDRIQGEIDGLVRCGDTALLIEAKSATMRPGARRGGEALLRHLRDTLAKAADQGTRAAAAFEREGTFKSDGRELVLGEDIHEVHPILVTLDDLSSVAPVLWQLEGSRVMPKAVSLPWVATLHELDLVTQTIEWPAQFIHFLRRRSRLNTFGRYLASDELDWWMHYLLHGLYFDDEDDPPGLVRFSSLTDPLDAWALNAQGLRQTPAPKPAMSLDAESRALLELICSERPGGWVSAACA